MTDSVITTARRPSGRGIAAALEGAIVPVMLRLALPTVVVLVVQALVGVVEMYFISFLGTDALAGAALVFPVLMLMQMMANGGVGGGVASAVARALGGAAPMMRRRWCSMRCCWARRSVSPSRSLP